MDLKLVARRLYELINKNHSNLPNTSSAWG